MAYPPFDGGNMAVRRRQQQVVRGQLTLDAYL